MFIKDALNALDCSSTSNGNGKDTDSEDIETRWETNIRRMIQKGWTSTSQR